MSAQTRSPRDRFRDGAPFALCILVSLGFSLTLIAVAGLAKGLLIYAGIAAVLLPLLVHEGRLVHVSPDDC